MVMPDLIVRTKRRSLSLIVNKDGKLIVRAPKRLQINDIFNFVSEKEKWILSKQKNILNIKNKNIDIFNIQTILFLGKRYILRKVEGVKNFELANGELIYPLKYNDENLLNKLIKWFIINAKTILHSRFEYFVNLLQIDARELIIMNNKTRWGSCDLNGNIKLNYRVVMLPHDIIDYIVVHELCHILQMNHSEEFYKLVKCVIPNYKILKNKLKEYDYLLGLYR